MLWRARVVEEDARQVRVLAPFLRGVVGHPGQEGVRHPTRLHTCAAPTTPVVHAEGLCRGGLHDKVVVEDVVSAAAQQHEAPVHVIEHAA